MTKQGLTGMRTAAGRGETHSSCEYVSAFICQLFCTVIASSKRPVIGEQVIITYDILLISNQHIKIQMTEITEGIFDRSVISFKDPYWDLQDVRDTQYINKRDSC